TVYQWTEDDFDVELPARLEGPVWIQGRLSLSDYYPSTSSSRRRYLSDLNAMRLSGKPDYRPFTGPIYWHAQTSGTIDAVTNLLGASTHNNGNKTASGWQHPGTPATYRLYPGGPEYEV